MLSHNTVVAFDKFIKSYGLNKEANISNKTKLTEKKLDYLTEILSIMGIKQIGSDIIQKILDLTLDYDESYEDKSENVNSNKQFQFTIDVASIKLIYELRDEKHKLSNLTSYYKSAAQVALESKINLYIVNGATTATLDADEIEILVNEGIALEYPWMDEVTREKLIPFRHKVKQIGILEKLFGSEIATNIKLLECNIFQPRPSRPCTYLAAFVFSLDELKQLKNIIVDVDRSASSGHRWPINLFVYENIKLAANLKDMRKTQNVARAILSLVPLNLFTKERAKHILENPDAIAIYNAILISSYKRRAEARNYFAYLFDKLMPYVLEKQQAISRGAQPYYVVRTKEEKPQFTPNPEISELVSFDVNSSQRKQEITKDVYAIAEEVFEKFADDDVNYALGIIDDNFQILQANILHIYNNGNKIGSVKANRFANLKLLDIFTNNLALIKVSEYYEDEYPKPVYGGYRKKNFLQVWDINTNDCLLNVKHPEDCENIIFKKLSSTTLMYYHNDALNIFNLQARQITATIPWDDKYKTCCGGGLVDILGEVSFGYLLKTTKGLSLLSKTNPSFIVELPLDKSTEIYVLSDERIVTLAREYKNSFTFFGMENPCVSIFDYFSFNSDSKTFIKTDSKSFSGELTNGILWQENILLCKNNNALVAMDLTHSHLSSQTIFPIRNERFKILTDNTVVIETDKATEKYKLFNLKNYLKQRELTYLTEEKAEAVTNSDSNDSLFKRLKTQEDTLEECFRNMHDGPLTPRFV